jgi:flagellar protein FlaG
MSSIEMNIATQVGDVSRPQQQHRDLISQQQTARVSEENDADKLAEQAVGAEELRAAAAEVQQVVEVASGRDLAFEIFEDTSSLFVKISDRGTGEMIKQIPSEDVLRMQARIQELVGMLVDEQA